MSKILGFWAQLLIHCSSVSVGSCVSGAQPNLNLQVAELKAEVYSRKTQQDNTTLGPSTGRSPRGKEAAGSASGARSLPQAATAATEQSVQQNW